jgi:hypothetical protein
MKPMSEKLTPTQAAQILAARIVKIKANYPVRLNPAERSLVDKYGPADKKVIKGKAKARKSTKASTVSETIVHTVAPTHEA